LRRRSLRVAATLVVTGLCTAYIVWKIDIRRVGHILAHASVGYFLLALAIMVLSVWPMAWRWQKLLEVPQLDRSDDVRTDVYWELATGELVVNVRNAANFGPGGRGYMLLHTTRQ